MTVRDGLAVGVDLGGTKTLAIVHSPSAGIIARDQITTDRHASPEITLTQVSRLVRNVIGKLELGWDDLVGVGVGVAGLVAPNRLLIDSIIFPTWRAVDVGGYLRQEIPARVVIDNDATMAAIGHWSGRQEDASGALVCLTLGTGVGAAVLIDGAPLRGPDGTAGQLGHVSVDANGRKCSCGSAGCLNAYISGTAIAERYLARTEARVSQREPGTPVTGRWVAEVAARGDAIAQEVLADTSFYLGVGMASLVNVFNPEIIAITGGVAELGEELLAPAREVMSQRCFRAAGQRVRVEQGMFGASTGAVGAAVSAWAEA